MEVSEGRGEGTRLLRAGPQRGMMGSNNHIITSSVGAVSDVRGIKEARRVHTQAASRRLCRSPSHLFTHTCREKSSPCEMQSHLLLWDARQPSSDTKSRVSQPAGKVAAQGLWGLEVTRSTEEVLTSKEREEAPALTCRGAEPTVSLPDKSSHTQTCGEKLRLCSASKHIYKDS